MPAAATLTLEHHQYIKIAMSNPRGNGPPLHGHLGARFLADIKAYNMQIPNNPTRNDNLFWKHMISHGDKHASCARGEFQRKLSEESGGPEPVWFLFSVFSF